MRHPLRKLALIPVALASLIGGAMPVPVMAESGIDDFFYDLFGCGSFGVSYPECKMTAVRVDGTSSRHTFSFDQVCSGVHEAHVDAAYDPGTGRAQESIKALSGGWSYRSQWNCASDPWIAPDSVACTNGKMSTKGTPGSFDPAAITYPTSAGSLSAKSRHVLAAQLQNALNANPPARPQPPSPPAPDVATGLDLTVIRIDGPDALQAGMTGTFSFIIGNIGDAAASVEVAVLFTGALDQSGQVYADSGVNCVVDASKGKVNATVARSGGQLDPKRSATITVQASGRAAGTGSVIAYINNSRTLAESDYGNDLGRRDIAVN
jgi:hypothetical protein